MLLTQRKGFNGWRSRRSEIARTLIERSRIATTRPRVRSEDLLRAVGDGRWELATLEERNVETQVEHVLETVVDVNPSALKKKSVGHQWPGRKRKTIEKGPRFLTGNSLSIRGNRCGNRRRRWIAALTTSRRSSRQHSGMSADPSSTSLERS